jgi:hypothetical protein
VTHEVEAGDAEDDLIEERATLEDFVADVVVDVPRAVAE